MQCDIEGLTRDCAELSDSWKAKSSGNVTRTRPPRTLGVPIWIADAHRDDGKRFVVRADEKLNAFVNLKRRLSGIAAFVLLGGTITLQRSHQLVTYGCGTGSGGSRLRDLTWHATFAPSHPH